MGASVRCKKNPPTELAYCKPTKDNVTAFCNLFDESAMFEPFRGRSSL